MSKRISKAVREEAAEGCQAAASTHWWRDDVEYEVQKDCVSMQQFFWSSEVEDLAVAAWNEARNLGLYCEEAWAEAEAMLRTGWTP